MPIEPPRRSIRACDTKGREDENGDGSDFWWTPLRFSSVTGELPLPAEKSLPSPFSSLTAGDP